MGPTILANRNETFLGERPPNINFPPTDPHSAQPVQNPTTTPTEEPKQQTTLPSGPYLTFPIGSYTKPQLKLLKRRLLSELQQVRSLLSRLDSLNPVPVPVQPPPKEKKKRGRKPGFKLTKNHPKDKALTLMMKRCGQILTKLMKQKSAWVFNKPVDVVALNLFDYQHVIKKPMDLGTVKSNLSNGVYTSPLHFADDVRLTFNNAMTYNPENHDVHLMAKKLLLMFNGLFDCVYEKYDKGRAGREMSNEEKAQLGRELEGLPPEAMWELMEIVRRVEVARHEDNDDEIEIDIEVLDRDTLWDLHRFVCDWRKKRKLSSVEVEAEKVEMVEKEGGEDDDDDVLVEIGEEGPVGSYPSVVIEKDVFGCTSHAGGSSSSSGGSDSGSD